MNNFTKAICQDQGLFNDIREIVHDKDNLGRQMHQLLFQKSSEENLEELVEKFICKNLSKDKIKRAVEILTTTGHYLNGRGYCGKAESYEGSGIFAVVGKFGKEADYDGLYDYTKFALFGAEPIIYQSRSLWDINKDRRLLVTNQSIEPGEIKRLVDEGVLGELFDEIISKRYDPLRIYCISKPTKMQPYRTTPEFADGSMVTERKERLEDIHRDSH